MSQVQVRNLVAWAGSRFSYAVGDLITLPEDIAVQRVALRLAEYLPSEEPANPSPAPRKAKPKGQR